MVLAKTPVSTSDALKLIVLPALKLFPPMLTSDSAKIQMLADGLQETKFAARVQMGHGPAHGFWQNELESIDDLLANHATKDFMITLCNACGVAANASVIYNSILANDILDAGVHRLLMWADPHPLPRVGDLPSAWQCYLDVQRPGTPRPLTWPWCYKMAMTAVQDASDE